MMKYRALLLLLTGVASARNDKCIFPYTLYENEPVSGDNSFAVKDFTDMDACGPNSHLEGVWYEIIGTGEEVTLKICTENQRLLSVGVFSACNSQSCLGFPPRQLRPASCDRNEYMTYQFFAERDRSYRVHVRANVIDFSKVSLGAQFKISYRTTGSPTAAPSKLVPTVSPTASEGTTKLPPSPISGLPINVIQPTPYEASNFGKISTCSTSPPTSYRVETETITYDYTLSKSPMSAAGVASEMEEILHQALSDKLMTCTFADPSYSVVEIGIGDRDRVTATSCTAGGANTCSIVRGSMEMEVAFPNGGRRLNDDLYRDLIPIFRDTLQSLGGEFQGFTDPESDVDDEDEDASAPKSIEQDSGDDNSSLFLGLGIAIGVIVLIALFICVRRMCRGETDKPLEGVHEPPQDEESTVPQLDSPAHEVDDGDVNEGGISFFSTVKLEGSDHDFRSCGNPECKHCKPESRPVFISTRGIDEPIDENRATGNARHIDTSTYNDGWATFDT
mmetsp:Transcript_19712/g.48440  ORF Transcript_19712/g.48440 Transcript_19712/m.48440 type:complete len:505 (-) Transcript_19712:136-1650(-)